MKNSFSSYNSVKEVSKETIIEWADSNQTEVNVDGISLRLVNKNGLVILHDFDKWSDVERVADILHLDSFDRQPVIIKQRAGAAAWDWELVGNAYEGLSYENHIDPISGKDDYSTYMKIWEDSVIYEIAIIIQK